MREIRCSVGNAIRSKEHPGDGDSGKRPPHLKQFAGGGQPLPFGDDAGGVLPVGAAEEERDEEEGVNASPDDEGPVGPVPEPGDEENDEDVADGLGLGDAGPAKRWRRLRVMVKNKNSQYESF